MCPDHAALTSIELTYDEVDTQHHAPSKTKLMHHKAASNSIVPKKGRIQATRNKLIKQKSYGLIHQSPVPTIHEYKCCSIRDRDRLSKLRLTTSAWANHFLVLLKWWQCLNGVQRKPLSTEANHHFCHVKKLVLKLVLKLITLNTVKGTQFPYPMQETHTDE